MKGRETASYIKPCLVYALKTWINIFYTFGCCLRIPDESINLYLTKYASVIANIFTYAVELIIFAFKANMNHVAIGHYPAENSQKRTTGGLIMHYRSFPIFFSV